MSCSELANATLHLANHGFSTAMDESILTTEQTKTNEFVNADLRALRCGW